MDRRVIPLSLERLSLAVLCAMPVFLGHHSRVSYGLVFVSICSTSTAHSVTLPRELLIVASFEEGGGSVLTSA